MKTSEDALLLIRIVIKVSIRRGNAGIAKTARELLRFAKQQNAQHTDL